MIAMIASTSHSSCCFFLHHQAKAQDFATEGLEEGRQCQMHFLHKEISWKSGGIVTYAGPGYREGEMTEKML